VKKLIVPLAAALFGLSCFEDAPVTPGEEDRLAPTSPRAVLQNVEKAFNRRDLNLLQAMLSERFVFHFDPDDVGQHPPAGTYVIPESWSYTEFWQAAGNLLEKAYNISLSIATAAVGEPGPNETTYLAENVTIRLLVMVDEMNGFIADQGFCNFELERYEGEGGKKLWRLTKWWDNTSVCYDAKPGVAPGSLGRILAFYR
jgi:hypothetical protein